MDAEKLDKALESTDEMIRLESEKLALLKELRTALRVRKIIPELDIKQPVSLVDHYPFCVKAGAEVHNINRRQYNYITGVDDD